MRTFLNTFENLVNSRVNIREDIRRFQKTLQYARSKVDYMISEFIYMHNKILISSPSFKIETTEKINLDGGKDKPDVKSKEVEMVKSEPDVKQKKEPDVKSNIDVKPNIELKHDVKKPDMNKITYEEEKVALILGTTAVFTVWWMFK